jgi:hypothetical protein
MDEKEFAKLLNNIYELKPEQMEKVFSTFYEMFSSRYYTNVRELPCAALAWRIKQALLLVRNRNNKKQAPRR